MTEDEFVEAVLSHLDMLYNLARRVTSSAQEAEDLVQETCVRALQGWRRSRPERLRPWLATICLNTARSQYRWRSTRSEVLQAEPGMSLPSADDTARTALDALDRETIHEAMAELSSEQREAIALMDLCGFTAAQVSEILGVPRNTVLARVHRGRKRLAVLLGERVTRDDA